MAKQMDLNKIVVFTGAGVSAESGIQTFRDTNGLWNEYAVSDVATPYAWNKHPAVVLDFYNQRRTEVCSAKPNTAHEAIAKLEEKFDVVVVTQNVDDLHERAGSTQVIHVHGELSKARSSVDDSLIYDIGSQPILMGDTCEKGSQLRPHIVWFGEQIQYYDQARQHIGNAGRVLVVGSSLSVFPAAGLLKKARHRADKVIIALAIETRPYGYQFIRAKAGSMVPLIVDRWLKGQKSTSL